MAATLQAISPTTGARWRTLPAAAIVLLVSALTLHVWGLEHALIDDAYIQLDYARTLTESGTWGMIDGRWSNTATSPLTVVITAVAGLLPGSLVSDILTLTVVEFLLMVLLLARIAKDIRHPSYGWIASAALVFNPLLLSALGMEGPLYVMLFIATLWAALRQRPLYVGIACGLLTLARPDGVLLLALILLFAAPSWRYRTSVALAFTATIAPWALFATVTFGSPLPESLFIKTAEGAWGGHSFGSGLLLYAHRFPFATALSFLAAPFAVCALFGAPPARRLLAGLPLMYATLHFAAYGLLGVPPYHWYYLHTAIPLALAGSYGMAVLATRIAPRALPSAAHVAAACCAPFAAGFVAFAALYGWPLMESPIHSNWATSSEYAAVAQWLNREIPADDTILLSGEIGTLAYYSNHALINEFSDQNIAIALARQDRAQSGLGRFLSDLAPVHRREEALVTCPDYVLEHVPDENRGPVLGPRFHGQLLMRWSMSSSWKPSSTLYLWRVSAAALQRHLDGQCKLSDASAG